MKDKIIEISIILLLFITTGCNNANYNKTDSNEINNSNEVINSMKVLINGKEYVARLEHNETVKSLVNMLPREYNMNELNGNEKYIYLNNTLPTNITNPKRINAGDIMLYGNNYLVIFYKTFDTTYSYTKIGHIDNLPDLGNENILVKFDI